MTRMGFQTMALAAAFAAAQSAMLAGPGGGGSTQPAPATETFAAVASSQMSGGEFNKIASLPSVPAGKRLVIEHVSGACNTAAASTQVIPYLNFAATQGGASYHEFESASKPWNTQVRHTFSKRVHIEVPESTAISFNVYRSDIAGGVLCTMTISGQMVSGQ